MAVYNNDNHLFCHNCRDNNCIIVSKEHTIRHRSCVCTQHCPHNCTKFRESSLYSKYYSAFLLQLQKQLFYESQIPPLTFLLRVSVMKSMEETNLIYPLPMNDRFNSNNDNNNCDCHDHGTLHHSINEQNDYFPPPPPIFSKRNIFSTLSHIYLGVWYTPVPVGTDQLFSLRSNVKGVDVSVTFDDPRLGADDFMHTLFFGKKKLRDAELKAAWENFHECLELFHNTLLSFLVRNITSRAQIVSSSRNGMNHHWAKKFLFSDVVSENAT